MSNILAKQLGLQFTRDTYYILAYYKIDTNIDKNFNLLFNYISDLYPISIDNWYNKYI